MKNEEYEFADMLIDLAICHAPNENSKGKGLLLKAYGKISSMLAQIADACISKNPIATEAQTHDAAEYLQMVQAGIEQFVKVSGICNGGSENG